MQTILITGIGRGIGKALAEKFLANGDFVIGTSTSGETSIANPNLAIVQLDLTSPESITSCTSLIASLNKPIDILINNAGISSGVESNPIINVSLLRKVLEVNLFGAVDFTERIIPMIKNGGHIVNVSSRMGSLKLIEESGSNWPDYRISKCAINMVTRILADRLKHKITVSSVHPGWVKTDMGGDDAQIEPSESAEDLFALATSRPESGQFWFKGEKMAW